MANKYAVKGINDDVDTCEVCGKRGLKRVVWLVELSKEGEELGDPMPVGTDCAGRMMGWRFGPKKIADKLSQMHRDYMEKIVSDAVKLTWRGMVVYRSVHWPMDLANAVASDKMTFQEAYDERTRRFPILAYHAGKIDLDTAYQLAAKA
jgi:hypothetical protein